MVFAEKAVQSSPSNGEARANLGMVYEAIDRDDEAIDQYLIAMELLDDPYFDRRYSRIHFTKERRMLLHKLRHDYLLVGHQRADPKLVARKRDVAHAR